MNRAIVAEYVGYKLQIKELEEKAKFIKDSVKSEIEAIYDPEHPPEMEDLGVVITLKPVPIWNDTEEILALKEKIKQLQADQRATQDADSIRTDLVVTEKKK